MEAFLYALAAVGLVTVAYFFGGKKYAVSAGVAALAVLYFVFGKQDSWTDAWREADKKIKEEKENLKDKQEKKEKKRDETDDKIEDSKKRTDDLKDREENVEENTPNQTMMLRTSKIGLKSLTNNAMRKIAFFIAFSLLFSAPAFGQEVPDDPVQDSVTVSVESLRNLKQEFTILENKVEIQDSIITEQTRQIKLYERRVDQTAKIDTLLKQRLKIRDERIEIRDERIERLEDEKTWEQIKKYIWTVGSLAIGFLVGSAR